MGFTNRGKMRLLEWGFRGGTIPTNLYVALVTSAAVPDADTNVLGDLTEIVAGSGYSAGGYQLTPNSTDFDVLVETDDDDTAHVEVRDITWYASGGSIPPSGDGAAYAVLTDDNPTLADREVLAYWSLEGEFTMPDGSYLTLEDLALYLVEP